MASPLKPLPRRLFELLEEQQEPFLLENGCPKRGFKSRGAVRCWGLKNRGGFRRRRTRGGDILRCLAAKLVSLKAIKRALSWERPKLAGSFSGANAAGFRRLSSCSDAGAGELSGEVGWKEAEHSPVSVLELHSEDSYADHTHSTEEENPTTSRLNSPTKCVSLQPRQLLLDFLKEMEEKMSGSTMQEEGIFPWEKQRGGDAAMLAHLLDLDLSGTWAKWTQFHAERREVGTEIGGMIFEEMREECVFDMLGGFHYCTLKHDDDDDDDDDDECNYEGA